MPLKELQWLTPFDEGSRATTGARTSKEAGAHGTRIRCNSIWSVIVPADGTRTATVGNGDFGTSPLLLGSSRTSRCLPVSFHVGCRNALHNGGSRNYVLIRFDDGVVRQCGEFELRQTKLRSRKIADEQFYTDVGQRTFRHRQSPRGRAARS